MDKPTTLQQAIRYFADEQVCIDTVAKMRWPTGPICPKCGGTEHYYLKTQKRWKCKKCYKQFSVKVGTIFEDSAISLDKWLTALWMLVNCKNGISSYEVGRHLGLTQKSAWFLLQRLRLALQEKSLVRIGGKGKTVEVDETYIGGLSRNMHANKRAQKITAHGPSKDKTIVMGILERGEKVRTMVVADTKRRTLQGIVREHTKPGTDLMSDASPSYVGLQKDYEHQVIDHAVAYVHGNVHTNGLENYWSLLKRGIKGTYVGVEPFHLFRYLDEQSFRFNNRSTKDNLMNDADRFDLALSQVSGKRLTFANVTGKPEKEKN
jgi:transposase-like protein